MSELQQGKPATERVYFMDLARSAILLSGVFFHAALIFDDQYHQVNSLWCPPLLKYWISFCRSFRMESLFLVSGFFSAVLVTSRGSKGFVINRFVRMGVPFLFCGFLFNPIQYLFFDPPSVEWLRPSFFIDGYWMDHLWNIGNLIVYESVAFTILWIFPKVHTWLAANTLRAVLVIAAYFAIRTGLELFWNHLPGFRGSRMFFYAPHLPIYAPAYMLGYTIHQNKTLRNTLFDWRFALPAAVLAHSLRFLPTFDFLPGTLPQHWAESTVVLQHVANALVFFALAKVFETKNLWVRRLSIASYTIYILHMPIQMLMYFLVPGMKQGYLAFWTLGFVSIFVVWVFHVQVVERFAWAGFLFNGKVYNSKTRSW